MSAMNSSKIGLLTSGGDAPGMNAAVRAVVRSGLARGASVYAIHEGYQGMVDGGSRIREMDWESVGGILQRGGTILGSARCEAFRSRDGRRQAAQHLVERGIDRLVIIGGDGSLTGVDLFRREWPELLAELAAGGHISGELQRAHASLAVVGLVGSIDNDLFGTDMTIGADTALHRITGAIDAITSTAASHQRTFIVEVMGRNCGYLALMSALAGAADWVLIPEAPPATDNWEEEMCAALRGGRQAGRRDEIVIVAEGAKDRHGNPIDSRYVKEVLVHRLGHDVRITVLGHVQRGGAPSAFDRNMSTVLGHAAVETVLSMSAQQQPVLIGLRGNRIMREPLMECVQRTHAVAKAITAGQYEKAMEMRGNSFGEAFRTLRTLVRALPRSAEAGQKRFRFAVLQAGGLAPGMNTATRVAVRLGVDQGHVMLGVRDSFQGLIEGNIEELGWMSVAGWGTMGGAQLGTSRTVPGARDYKRIARQLKKHEIQGILVIGAWSGYEAAYGLYQQREHFPEFDIPIICLPVSINNNLPGTEFSIGADTALNSIVAVVDKIKQSAVATHRVFIVEVMGRQCGYLALMSGMATGAERVYLPEEGVKLEHLQADLVSLLEGFAGGKRMALLIRNENVSSTYDTSLMRNIFQAEGQGQFEVRHAILGHLQQGGDPSPFDRIQSTRLAKHCIEFLIEQASANEAGAGFIGLQHGEVQFHAMDELPALVDRTHQRPRAQWWMGLRAIAQLMGQPGPKLERSRASAGTGSGVV